MPILKKRPDDFTGVEVIVDDKPLYIQAKDTPMELAETFKSGIKNEYDRLIIGNQELFISIRDIINSVVVKNFEKKEHQKQLVKYVGSTAEKSVCLSGCFTSNEHRRC